MLKIQQFQQIPFYFKITSSLQINSKFGNKSNNLVQYRYTIISIVNSTTSEFLFVRPGDYVVIKKEENCEDTKEKKNNYWVGQVINCIGGARNPNSWTLFQVANIDNGEITIINADIVEKILKPYES